MIVVLPICDACPLDIFVVQVLDSCGTVCAVIVPPAYVLILCLKSNIMSIDSQTNDNVLPISVGRLYSICISGRIV